MLWSRPLSSGWSVTRHVMTDAPGRDPVTVAPQPSALLSRRDPGTWASRILRSSGHGLALGGRGLSRGTLGEDCWEAPRSCPLAEQCGARGQT